MNAILKSISRKIRPLTLLAASLGFAGFSDSASARDDGRYGDRHGRDYRHGDEHRYDRRYEYDRDPHDHGGKTDVRIGINIGGDSRPRYTERSVRYWVEPVYRTHTERVWVEPVYKCVTERVWVEPVYKTVYEEVCVPARYEIRECVRYVRGRRIVTRERVLVEPAHTDRVARRVCVREGYWNTVERQVCVREGHWDVVERKVCVSEGRWDHRVERVEVSRRDDAFLHVKF